MSKNAMRPYLSLLLLAAFVAVSLPTVATADDATEIAAVIDSAYVEGIWKQLDADMIRAGFASTFVMQVNRNGELSTVTLDQWMERMPLGTPNEGEVEAKIEVLDVTGSAAAARVQLHVDGKHAFTDYMGLYKTADGWKIVNKHYQGHR